MAAELCLLTLQDKRHPPAARGGWSRSDRAGERRFFNWAGFIPPPGPPFRSGHPPHEGAGYGLCRARAWIRSLVVVGVLFLCFPAVAQGTSPAAVNGLEGQHPAEYFKRAKELFDAGRRDDSVFAFYFGQLRYRRHLIARPHLPKDKDPALFAALMATIGPPINQYAFGDIPRLARSIDAVLAHDRRSPDRATPQAQFPQAHSSVRSGLSKMKSEILKRRESIRDERLKNGLTNRT